MLISRISYRCRWDLTGFYPTWHFAFMCPLTCKAFDMLFMAKHNEHDTFLYFGGLVYINGTSVNTFLWLGVYLSYTPWKLYFRYTPVKAFEIWLQWDKMLLSYMVNNYQHYQGSSMKTFTVQLQNIPVLDAKVRTINRTSWCIHKLCVWLIGHI